MKMELFYIIYLLLYFFIKTLCFVFLSQDERKVNNFTMFPQLRTVLLNKNFFLTFN